MKLDSVFSIFDLIYVLRDLDIISNYDYCEISRDGHIRGFVKRHSP